MLGGDVGVVGNLPEGTYNRPQDPALLPVGYELGLEAVARAPTKAATELLGHVVVIGVDLQLAGVDDRVEVIAAGVSRRAVRLG